MIFHLNLIIFSFSTISFLQIAQSNFNNNNEISSTNKLCGYLEFLNTSGSSIILNVTEGQAVSQELFAQIYDKVNSAAIILSDSACKIEICGYKTGISFGPPGDDCKEFSTSSHLSHYSEEFRLTHISCGCKKNRPNCEKSDCNHYKYKSVGEFNAEWPEGACGILFQEKDCQQCYHDAIFLKLGEVFETRNYAVIRSGYILPWCIMTSGKGLPYSYEYSSQTHDRKAVHDDTKTPGYASISQLYYYCHRCRNSLKINMTSSSVAPVTLRPSVTPLVKVGSNEIDKPAFSVPIWFVIIASVVFLCSVCISFWCGIKYTRSKPKSSQDQKTVLSNADIQQFTEGEVCIVCKNCEGLTEITDTFSGTVAARLLPYDSKYEIDKNHIEFGQLIGEGAFGNINKGTLRTFDEHRFKTVAIKTVKENAGREYVKDLLNEIKVRSYLGHHPNLVYFIGACTVNLEKGQVYYIMELCSHGSLKSYLDTEKKSLKSRPACLDLPSNNLPGYVVTVAVTSEADESKILEDHNQTLFNLMVKWSQDIATAMEYLDLNKILHIDIATRNILLGENFTAKLADFGLSRKLYEKLSYEKSTEGPIPFKWMALESLTQNNYTVKSDVWSYGVTLWEIFDLGSHPYPKMSLKEICSLLLSGKRLTRPAYATEEIYDEMLCCWMEEPSSRPDFKDLKSFFERIQNNYNTEVIDS